MDQVHVPLSNLQLYSVFSTLGVLYAVVYALTTNSDFFETLHNDAWCAAVSLAEFSFGRTGLLNSIIGNRVDLVVCRSFIVPFFHRRP